MLQLKLYVLLNFLIVLHSFHHFPETNSRSKLHHIIGFTYQNRFRDFTLDSKISSDLSPTSFLASIANHRWKNSQFCDLNKKDKGIVIESLSNSCESLNASEISSLLIGLAKFEFSWEDISGCKNIEKHLASVIYEMDERSLGDLFWALGTMNAKYSIFSSQMRSSLLQKFETIGWKLNVYAHTTALWAIAKMGFKWNQFSVSLSRSILDKTYAYGQDISPHQASKVIWALGRLGCTFIKLHSNMLQVYLEKICKIKNLGLNSNCVLTFTRTLIGIAKLKVDWTKLSIGVRSHIWQLAIVVFNFSLDRKSISSTIWALGSIGASVHELSQVTTTSICKGIESALSSCNAWSLCNIVWGLSKISFEWSDFPQSLQDSLQMNIARLTPSMNAIDVSILSWSFGAMHVPLQTFPNYVLVAFYKAVLTQMPFMKPEELSRLIWGLSGSGISWDGIPAPIQWNINSALRREGDQMSPQDIANCAYGFALLAFDTQYPFDVAFRGAHEELLRIINFKTRKYLRDDNSCHRSTSTDLGIIDNATGEYMGGGGMVENINAKGDFGMLRVLGASARSGEEEEEGDDLLIEDGEQVLHKGVHIEIGRSLQAFPLQDREIEQLRIFCHYVNGFKRVSDAGNIPKSFLNNELFSMPADKVVSKNKISNLQRDILGNLITSLRLGEGEHNNANKFEVEFEYSSFDGVFPVDAAVECGGTLVALIEIDGPHHYLSDGTIRRKDLLKEAMYKAVNPDCLFYRVRWDVANKLGTQVIGEDLSDLIIMHYKSMNPISSMFRQTERTLSEFFSWGLRNKNM